MRIYAEDTAALIIDFQEKLVPAIANNEEIVAKAATFVAGLKELGVPMAVTQQYTKGLGDTVAPIKEALIHKFAISKSSPSDNTCESFVTEFHAPALINSFTLSIRIYFFLSLISGISFFV